MYSVFIDLKDLHESFEKEFDPLFKKDTKSQKTVDRDDTSSRNKRHDPPDDPLITTNDPLRSNLRLPRPSPSNIGRSDLDPFGTNFDPSSGTSGMIFDPFRHPDRRQIPTNLPRGAVPPGARFDPFGPPDPDSDLYRGSSSTRVG